MEISTAPIAYEVEGVRPSQSGLSLLIDFKAIHDSCWHRHAGIQVRSRRYHDRPPESRTVIYIIMLTDHADFFLFLGKLKKHAVSVL